MSQTASARSIRYPLSSAPGPEREPPPPTMEPDIPGQADNRSRFDNEQTGTSRQGSFSPPWPPRGHWILCPMVVAFEALFPHTDDQSSASCPARPGGSGSAVENAVFVTPDIAGGTNIGRACCAPAPVPASASGTHLLDRDWASAVPRRHPDDTVPVWKEGRPNHKYYRGS